MAKTHPRSPSPEPKTAGLKRPKIGHPSPITAAPASDPEPANHPEDAIACFAPDLLDADNVGTLAASYSSSEPFKHALVGKLFRDDFLQKVKDECLSELHFTEKETDIYKVTSSPLLLRPLLSSPSGQPDRRSSIAFLSHGTTSRAPLKPRKAPRCALFDRVPRFLARRHGLRPTLGGEAGHVDQHLPQRLPPAQPRRCHRHATGVVHPIHASTELPALAKGLGRRARVVPRHGGGPTRRVGAGARADQERPAGVEPVHFF